MKNLNSKNYEDEVKINEITVVDFTANWCPDCRKILPVIKEMEKDYESKVAFFQVNFDEEEPLKEKLNITRIPTLIFYKNGVETGNRLVEPDGRVSIENELKKLF